MASFAPLIVESIRKNIRKKLNIGDYEPICILIIITKKRGFTSIQLLLLEQATLKVFHGCCLSLKHG